MDQWSWTSPSRLFASLLARVRRAPIAIVAASFVGAAGHAALIPPDQMFFKPSTLQPGFYPAAPVAAEAPGGPWEAVWTKAEVLAVDPGRFDIELLGIEILPILNANPANPTSDGAYRQAQIDAINAQNYLTYYRYAPGVDYSADLTDNVITVTINHAGPWTFRVKTKSAATPGGAQVAKDYTFTAMINDRYLLPDGTPDPMWELQRVSRIDGIFQFTLAGGEVHIVSASPPGGDKALENTKGILDDQDTDFTEAGSVDDFVHQVCDAVNANGGQPVDVVFYGHGSGSSTAGSARLNVGSDCIGSYCGTSWCDIGNLLKGKAKSLILVSCNVGNDSSSMQTCATYLGATVKAYTCYVTVCEGGWFSDGYFNTSATGNVKKSFGIMEIPPLAYDLNGNECIDCDDLAELLAQWGGPGDADVDSSGVVDVDDLIGMIDAWYQQF